MLALSSESLKSLGVKEKKKSAVPTNGNVIHMQTTNKKAINFMKTYFTFKLLGIITNL